MKDKIFGVLQRVGRSFMLPIAILPVAGLLLGVGGSFTNETMLEAYGLMGIMGPGTFLNAILKVMSAAGDIVFTNLPIIFAIFFRSLYVYSSSIHSSFLENNNVLYSVIIYI